MTFLPRSNKILLCDIIFVECVYMIILAHVDKFPNRAVEEGPKHLPKYFDIRHNAKKLEKIQKL